MEDPTLTTDTITHFIMLIFGVRTGWCGRDFVAYLGERKTSHQDVNS